MIFIKHLIFCMSIIIILTLKSCILNIICVIYNLLINNLFSENWNIMYMYINILLIELTNNNKTMTFYISYPLLWVRRLMISFRLWRAKVEWVPRCLVASYITQIRCPILTRSKQQPQFGPLIRTFLHNHSNQHNPNNVSNPYHTSF